MKFSMKKNGLSQQMNSQNDFQILSKNVSTVLQVLILKLLT